MEQPIKLETRVDLYNAVWSEPLIRVAAKLGLSDVGLAKLCGRLKVPVPGRGYWAKVKAGAKVRKRPLPDPDNDAGNPHDLDLLRRRFARAVEMVSTKERIRASIGEKQKATPTATPVEIHPMVKSSMGWLERSGLRVTEIRRKHQCVAIAVSSGLLERATKVMSLAIAGLEAHGIRVEVTKPVGFDEAGSNRTPVESRTIAHVHGFQIPFEVYEGEVEVEVPPEDLPPPKKNAPPGPDRPHPTKIIPSGKLAIYIHDERHYGIRRRWADRKKVLVELQIPAFVEGVMLLAEHRKQEEEAWAKRRAQWDEEARIRGLAEERKRVQSILIYDLKNRAEDVITGKEILAFLTEMQDHLRQKGEAVNLGSELDAWVHWAYLHGEALIENAFENFSPLRVPPQEKRFPGYG